MKKLKEEKNNYINRLKRIEGQIRGIQQMIDNERSYTDVSTQILSVVNALKSLNNNMIKTHLKNDSLSKLSGAEIAKIEEALSWIEKTK